MNPPEVLGPAGTNSSGPTNNTNPEATKHQSHPHLRLLPGGAELARCDWLRRSNGAVAIRATFTVFDLWHPDLWDGLNLPPHYCADCPIVRSGWGLAA